MLPDPTLADLWPLLESPVCPACREPRAPRRGILCPRCARTVGAAPLREGDPLLSLSYEEAERIVDGWHDGRRRPAPPRRAPATTRAPRRTVNVDAARAAPLLDVVSTLGLELPRRTGARFRIPCPVHGGEHPNCAMDTGRGLWKCHVCGEGGDGIRLVEKVRECDFLTAVRFILGEE
jgi:hypothetical protein